MGALVYCFQVESPHSDESLIRACHQYNLFDIFLFEGEAEYLHSSDGLG